MGSNKKKYVHLAEMNRQLINRTLVSAQEKQMGITIVSVGEKGQKKNREWKKLCFLPHRRSHCNYFSRIRNSDDLAV
jgi:predicted aldo/keto reductase-like oxidoreductase